MRRRRGSDGGRLAAKLLGGTALALAPLLLGCFSSAPGLGMATAGGGPGDATARLGSFEVASLGAPHGTIAPTTCVTGDRQVFLGADLIDPDTHLVVRLVVDPLAGPALRVYDADAPFDRSVLFFREECTTFEMKLGETGWKIDDVLVRRLELEIECENEDGATIRGSAAARCN